MYMLFIFEIKKLYNAHTLTNHFMHIYLCIYMRKNCVITVEFYLYNNNNYIAV
jgi:hypothetical protein